MTDHGNMHGAARLLPAGQGRRRHPGHRHRGLRRARVQAATRTGSCGASRTRRSDDVSGSGAYLHKTIWAQNNAGPAQPVQAVAPAPMPRAGYVKWPRMDKEIIAEHADGLMATTGCPSGEVQTRLRLGQFDEALKAAAEYQDIFGKENYFLELMDHGLDIERRVRDGLLEIGRKLGIPPVVTNDSHYTHESDAEAHDAAAVRADRQNTRRPEPVPLRGRRLLHQVRRRRCTPSTPSRYLAGGLPEHPAGRRAGRHERHVRVQQPDAAVSRCPEGETEEELVPRGGRGRAWTGATRTAPDEQRRQQAEYEIERHLQMGFPAYFLVVADFIMWAKNNGIAVGPGRGSAAGSHRRVRDGHHRPRPAPRTA